MRRWNGWGDDAITYPITSTAARRLADWLGSGSPMPQITLEEALTAIPASRLPSHPLISTAPLDRLRHACGQSLPDWIALQSGRIERFPDGVAYPSNNAEVRELINFAIQAQVCLIPYGGGTSVVGHITPPEQPSVIIDLGRMNRLLHFDETSLLAKFGAGINGPDLEAQLRAHGCTLGHFPQSFEYSTLGGWVATRSTGQQSLHYGRIERLFAGGRLETPAGLLELPPEGYPPFPASAAGPDLREVVLGSEGRLGILTEITVRASPLPEREDFCTIFFPDFERGLAAAREMLQAAVPVGMLRLSSAPETETTLALAGHEQLIAVLERLLTLRRLGTAKCMLLLGFIGSDSLSKNARRDSLAIAARHNGVNVGRTFGEQWHKNRFRTPYLRNTLWDLGYAVDTLETATDWSNLPRLLAAIETALSTALAETGERVHVFTHLSHLYPHGASIYTTFIFRLAPTPEETLWRWQVLKAAASQGILAQHGTISHQHGVGSDHLPYLSAEKGELGMQVLASILKTCDPDGIMNPGKLIR